MKLGSIQDKETLLKEVAEYNIPLLDAPKTVLDIGANVGAFSLMAAQKWPEAKIFAYEPEPENIECFNRNCTNPNILLSQSAVRSFNGRADMLLGDSCVTHSFHDLGRQTKNTVSVDCVDAAIIGSAEFIKIDTEGCEIEVLNKIHLGNTKAIAIEYHSKSDKQYIEMFLSVAGFEPFRNTHCGDNEGVLRFVKAGVPLNLPKCKLFIGIPVYGAVEINFWKCTMHLMASFPLDCVVYPACGDSLVSRARNHITTEFLKSDCTHLLMIDSDLTFSTDHIKRIMSHGEDIVGGFYPKKKEGAPELVCNIRANQDPMDERRLLNLKYIGTGFICIARRVFEKMIETYGNEIRYLSDVDRKSIEYDLWPVGVYKYPDGAPARYLSEDWFFCQRAIDCGFKVYGDMGILLKHTGSATYPLSYQEKEIFAKPLETVSSDSAVATFSPAMATA